MTGAVRFLRPRREPSHTLGQNVRCRRCGQTVDVVDVPPNPKKLTVCLSCQYRELMVELPVPFSEQHPPRRAA